MGNHTDPIPLCQELIDAVINHVKNDMTTLQSCRLVSKDFQKQTHCVETYLVKKTVFLDLYRCWTNRKPLRYKPALLGLAVHVHNLIINKEPTASPNGFTVEDIFRFENLKTLRIVSAFWTKP